MIALARQSTSAEIKVGMVPQAPARIGDGAE